MTGKPPKCVLDMLPRILARFGLLVLPWLLLAVVNAEATYAYDDGRGDACVYDGHGATPGASAGQCALRSDTWHVPATRPSNGMVQPCHEFDGQVQSSTGGSGAAEYHYDAASQDRCSAAREAAAAREFAGQPAEVLTRLIGSGGGVRGPPAPGETPRGYVSIDNIGSVKETLRKARAGDVSAQREIAVIKRLRENGTNVHIVDPTLRPGVTHDIFFGGRKGLAEGVRGEIKTLTGEGARRTITTQLRKARDRQLGPHGGGSIFLENASRRPDWEVFQDAEAYLERTGTLGSSLEFSFSRRP